jgi:hypothetical protein
MPLYPNRLALCPISSVSLACNARARYFLVPSCALPSSMDSRYRPTPRRLPDWLANLDCSMGTRLRNACALRFSRR